MLPESGFRTAANWRSIEKIAVTSQFSDMRPSSNFFDFVSLVKLSYYSKFHVNIITGSGVNNNFLL